MSKALILLLFPLLIVLLASLLFAQSEWTNICPDPSNYYCKNVGKTAYDAEWPKRFGDVRLGKIIGVAWRPKGTVIGISKAIPKARIPQEIRLSPRDAYYYIIDDGWGEPFLRQCREVNAR
jgi:hypothetical protein